MLKIDLDGLAKVMGGMDKVKTAISAKGIDIIERAGRQVERRAKENISGQHGHQRHIITDNLRGSIDTQSYAQGWKFIAVIGTDVHYAPFVEARDRTGGYLGPSLEESQDEVLNAMVNAIQDVIND